MATRGLVTQKITPHVVFDVMDGEAAWTESEMVALEAAVPDEGADSRYSYNNWMCSKSDSGFCARRATWSAGLLCGDTAEDIAEQIAVYYQPPAAPA